MPTTFNVISLGNFASIDPTEGNVLAENASSLVGVTFGGVGDALVNDFVELSQVADTGGDPTWYEQDNTIGNDTFSINGGPAQTYDGGAVYNATLTYIDGSTASITAAIIQDTAGNTYLAPEFSANADQAALEAGAIRSLTLNSVAADAFDGFTNDRQAWDGFVTCFTKGTKIQTQAGLVAIEALQVGDLILTMDHGFQPLRWIGSRTVKAEGNLAPVLFRKGAIGNSEDFLVSPQHRILIRGWQAEIMLGACETIVPAKFFVNGRDILRRETGQVTYFHIMFDRHELIYAAGIASESFHPGVQAMGGLDREVREEVLTLFPELRRFGATGYGKTARTVARSFEAKLLCACGAAAS